MTSELIEPQRMVADTGQQWAMISQSSRRLPAVAAEFQQPQRQRPADILSRSRTAKRPHGVGSKDKWELEAVSRVGQSARGLTAAGGRSSADPRAEAASLIDPIAVTHPAVVPPSRSHWHCTLAGARCFVGRAPTSGDPCMRPMASSIRLGLNGCSAAADRSLITRINWTTRSRHRRTTFATHFHCHCHHQAQQQRQSSGRMDYRHMHGRRRLIDHSACPMARRCCCPSAASCHPPTRSTPRARHFWTST